MSQGSSIVSISQFSEPGQPVVFLPAKRGVDVVHWLEIGVAVVDLVVSDAPQTKVVKRRTECQNPDQFI